jgi:hypothetical protein
MPKSRLATTASMSADETPLIVCESLTQRITPEMNVEVPRVAMSESISSPTTIAPLMTPMTSPTASVAAIEVARDHSCVTLRIASVIAAIPMVAATERS